MRRKERENEGTGMGRITSFLVILDAFYYIFYIFFLIKSAEISTIIITRYAYCKISNILF